MLFAIDVVIDAGRLHLLVVGARLRDAAPYRTAVAIVSQRASQHREPACRLAGG